MPLFFCVCRYGSDIRYMTTTEGANAIEAIRKAVEKSTYTGGTWTAYTKVVTKAVRVERIETRRVLFSEAVA